MAVTVNGDRYRAILNEFLFTKILNPWYKAIIRLFFFENEQGMAFTVNGDHYRAILN